MKKVLGILLLVALLAAPAFAESVKNSKHNLSTSGPGSVKSTDYDEICVFCHTPHAANTAVSLAPLWNRGVVTGASLTPLYNSSSLESTNRPSTVDVDSTDAPLCLSCHDGSNLAGQLVNPSNLAGLTSELPLPWYRGFIANSPITAILWLDLGVSGNIAPWFFKSVMASAATRRARAWCVSRF